MSAEQSSDELRELEAERDRLDRQRTAQPDDRGVQERLRENLERLAQLRGRELERVGGLYDNTVQQLEQHRRRSAVTVHDLKTPITISLLNLELLAMEQDAQQTAFYLTGVRRELEFMLDTISNLLELDRSPGEGDEIAMAPVPLADLVDGVVARMSVLIADKPELSLKNEVPRGIPLLRGNAHRLTRVFNNLFSNAIKYTEHGYVRVTAESLSDRAYVRIVVEDTGSGMDPDRVTLVFRYYEGDPERADSTGIGLAFVKQIVDGHDGDVWIESERGKGTRVFVELPVWRDGG